MSEAAQEQARGVHHAAIEAACERLSERLAAWEEKQGDTQDKEGGMSGFNRVVLMGRLTRDPGLKQTPSGRTVADLGLAVSEVYKDRNGANAERVCFVDLVAWGRQAETCVEYLKKGSPVLVEGRLQLDRWETPDGQKRSKHRVRADRVRFLNGNRPPPGAPRPEAVAAAGAEEPMPL